MVLEEGNIYTINKIKISKKRLRPPTPHRHIFTLLFGNIKYFLYLNNNMKLRIKHVITPIKTKWVLQKQEQLGWEWKTIIEKDDYGSCRESYLDEILNYMHNHILAEDTIEETNLTLLTEIEKWKHQLIDLPKEEKDCGCHDKETKTKNKNGKKTKRSKD